MTKIWVVFLVVASTFGAVHETYSMKEATAAVAPDTLFVTDIDNTILRPKQMLGSDEWFDHTLKSLLEKGVPQKDAENKAVSDWTRIQKVTEVELVENETADLYRSLQFMKTPILALTARPFEFADATKNQLKSLGVRLYPSPLTKQRTVLMEGHPDARFVDGILFVGGNNKGEMLTQFLKTLKLSFKRIVFVDDKLKHVKNVDAALAKVGIPYDGYYYRAADKKASAYDPKIADLQSRFLILNDGDAKRLLDMKF